MPVTAGVVENRRSHLYHAANCRGAAATSEKKRVAFASGEEAEKVGYRRAGGRKSEELGLEVARTRHTAYSHACLRRRFGILDGRDSVTENPPNCVRLRCESGHRPNESAIDSVDSTNSTEDVLEKRLVENVLRLKYVHRPDIRNRASLERNFREKFEDLKRVILTVAEFQPLLDEFVTPDVFTAADTARNRNRFSRDGGTPLNYTLVNINEWCKNTFGSSTSSASTPTTATIGATCCCSSTVRPPPKSNYKPSAPTPAARSSRLSSTSTTPAAALARLHYV